MIIKHAWFGAALAICLAAPAVAADKVYTLQDAYQSAFSANEAVKISQEGVIQAESRVDQAWTYLYPRIEGRSSFTRYNEVLPETGTFIFQPLSQFQAALVLRQPLYTGGRTLAALRIAQTTRDASTSTAEAVRQGTMLRVAQVYYGVIRAQKQIEVSRRSLERMERHKKVTEREAATRRTKANVSALLRATTLVNSAKINLVRAEDGLKIARERFNLETRLPADASLMEPAALEPLSGPLDRLIETAAANRPDYAAARQNVMAAREMITVVRGAHLPQLSAEGAVQYQDSHPETAFDGRIYYGAIRLQIPIFEGGLIKAETAEARSKAREAELRTSYLEHAIEDEVHDSYITMQTIGSVLETAKQQLGYARENFDAVEGLYREGLVGSLSMIDAEQALSQAEQEVVNSTYDHQLAILRVKKSIGVLGKE